MLRSRPHGAVANLVRKELKDWSRDRRSILLRGHSGRGWWFRTDGPDVAIEPSVHIDEGLTRRSLQIVVRGSARTDSETKIRWKLSPAGSGGDPT